MLYVTSSSAGSGSGSGSGFIYTLHDSNTLTAEPGYHYILDTMPAGGAVTVTLPQGNNGDTIAFSDRTDTFSASNVTLNSTGTDTLTDGFSQSLTLDVDRSVIQLTFFNGIWSITGAAGIVDTSWGNITGDIQNQTDLINILETKTDVPAVEALVQAGLNKLRSSTKFYVSKTGSDSNVGTSLAEPFLTVRHAVSQSNPGDVIEIEAGVYEEICPIVVPRDVAIQGDALRRTIIKPTPQTNLLGIFKVDSGFYCDGITFAGHQADDSGNISFAISLNQNADNTDIGASDIGAYILKSPYVRNCTSYTAEDDDGLAGSLSTGTTGGGFLIDGAACASNSPIRSFVVDSFTQINLNGPGGLVRNNGYCQLVSCFGTFCSYHVKCETGGQVNLSNSTTNFGTYGLVADGYSPSPIFTAQLQNDAYGIPGILVKSVVFDSTTNVLTSNSHGFVTNTKVTFKSTDGELPPEITAGVTYYVINPLENTFNISLTPSGTVLDFSTNGIGSFEVKAQGDTSVNLINFTENTIGTFSRPLPGMLLFLNNKPYVVTGSTPITNGYNVSFYSDVSGGLSENVLAGAVADFRLRSQIATGGHNMEYVGAGTNYLALPWYGGVPIPENQIQEFNNGKVFYTITDELGNFKVGSAFSVDGTTGAVTISTDEFNLSGLNYIGPFSRNGGLSTVGVQLKEISDDPNLISSTGASDGNTVPTQTAVVSYTQNNYLALDGSNSPTDDLDLGSVNVTNVGLINGVDVSVIDNKLNRTGDTISSVDGSGFLGYPAQSANPPAPSSGFRFFADSLNRLSWRGQNGFIRTFDGTANTADRSYTLPNESGTIALTNNGQIINGVAQFTQATKPTTRVNGSALVIGDRWYKSDDGTNWYWSGINWLGEFEVYQLQLDYPNTLATIGINVSSISPVLYSIQLVRLILTLRTAATGSSFVVDINVDGNSILSTKLSIDAGELTSLTAAIPYVTTSNPMIVSANSTLTVDIDQVGSTANGVRPILTIEARRVIV